MKMIITSFLILATTLVTQARLIRHWSDEELLEKSDLVVIATPTTSADTQERTNLPGLFAQHVIGVETGFAVSSVVKGDKALKNFVLHHYRADEERAGIVSNGPCFIAFNPEGKRTYRLFLIRETDGRYAPTVGQVDPGVQGITGFPGAAGSEFNPTSQAVGTESAPKAHARHPDPTEAVRFTVELTDGSRILGSPIHDNFKLQTSLGSLNLRWQLVKSVEKVGGEGGVSIVFRNDDRAEGTLEAPAFALRTVLGDLSVPLALTRRIRVDSVASGGGPVAYWSFNDPANLGADDSGHDHLMTAKGAQSTEGKFGKGAATGGPNEGNHFIAGSHPDLQFSGDFTLAVWAWRGNPMYDGDQLIAKDGEFSLRRYQLPTERYDVELCGKQGLQLAKVSETKSGLPLESWTLIVVCRKDDRLSIRVNDLPAVEAKVAPGEVGGDSPLYIGSSASGYPWQGKVDEIKKWNHALSEDEQRELFRDPPVMPVKIN